MKHTRLIRCGLLTLTLALTVLTAACGNADVTVNVPDDYTMLLELSDYGLGDNDDGYKSKTTNDDGSITYVFTRQQYQALMSKLRGRIEETMNDTDSRDHIKEITANDDYTFFTFVSDTEDLTFADRLTPASYVVLGNIYSVFTGNPGAEIGYEIVSKDTGKVLDSSDSDAETTETTTTTAAPDTTEKPRTTAAKSTTKKQTTTAAEKTEAPAEESENTYQHNALYDIVDAAVYRNSIGSTVFVHKLLAKKSATVSCTLLAYAPDGSVIGKSSDEIILTEGKTNYFRYEFSADLSEATFQTNAQAKKDSFMIGERNAVEMTQYNQSGDQLYLTLEQTGDDIGSFAKFKLLFYKDDKIVDTEDGYLSLYAPNLNGKGSSDVASVWVYGTDYDRIEFMYEP